MLPVVQPRWRPNRSLRSANPTSTKESPNVSSFLAHRFRCRSSGLRDRLRERLITFEPFIGSHECRRLIAVAPRCAADRPDYEQAYYNGTIVTMNHIEVPQNPGALVHAAADLYAVIYPANHALWPSPPLCNPCVHNGNPIYHDHVLDSIPSDPGHGEFNPLWHVFVIRPANSSPATQTAYAARLPMKSEADVDAAIAAGVAVEVDTVLLPVLDRERARREVTSTNSSSRGRLGAARPLGYVL